VVAAVATEGIGHDEERSIHEPKARVRISPPPITSATTRHSWHYSHRRCRRFLNRNEVLCDNIVAASAYAFFISLL